MKKVNIIDMITDRMEEKLLLLQIYDFKGKETLIGRMLKII